MRALLCFASLLAAAVLVPAAAFGGQANTLTDTHGGVRATVTFQGSSLYASNVRITIKRAGTAVLKRAKVRDSASGQPTTSGPASLMVVDLNGDGEPEVMLDLFTGGAHCCSYSRIYQFDPTYGDYTWVEHEWGNYLYSIDDLDGDGIPELASADDRFAYAFAAYAFSIPPVLILEYREGALRDVTREHPRSVRRDAKKWWKLYVKERRKPMHRRVDLRGILAGWAADKYQLGQQKDVWKTLKGARARGELRGSSPWPKGRKYLRELRGFLEATGYAS